MYQRAKIYELVDKRNMERFYIGSTCGTLSNRFSKHRYDCKGNPDREVYKKMNEIGVDNVDIVLIEEYPCESKEQLHQREGYWIRLDFESVTNNQIAGRTNKDYRKEKAVIIKIKKKEHYENNKDKILEKQKDYYNENKEVILEKQKTYRDENKDIISEKGKEYYLKNKDEIIAKTKEYYENNKEKVLEKTHEYYENNKDKIHEYNQDYYTENRDKLLDYQKDYMSDQNNYDKVQKYRAEYRSKNRDILRQKASEKVVCECGKSVRRSDISTHRKTKTHIEKMSV